jgi:hypothetical protein
VQKLNVQTRSTFVRGSVEENDTTTFVIDSVMPYYPSTDAVATAPRTKREDGEDACLMSPGELATLKDSTNNARTTGDFGDVVGYPETLYGLLDDADGEDWWA